MDDVEAKLIQATEGTMEQLLTAKELAKQLGKIGASTLYKLGKEKKVPAYRVGHSGIRFIKSEVLDAMRIRSSADDVAVLEALKK